MIIYKWPHLMCMEIHQSMLTMEHREISYTWNVLKIQNGICDIGRIFYSKLSFSERPGIFCQSSYNCEIPRRESPNEIDIWENPT